MTSTFVGSAKRKDKWHIYIVRRCFMYTKNLSHVDRDRNFSSFFFRTLRFLSAETFSMWRGCPRGSVKIETSLLLPKQLIHRKGNRPLLNFLSIRLTASRVRREELPWITSIPCASGGKKNIGKVGEGSEGGHYAWINLRGDIRSSTRCWRNVIIFMTNGIKIIERWKRVRKIFWLGNFLGRTKLEYLARNTDLFSLRLPNKANDEKCEVEM